MRVCVPLISHDAKDDGEVDLDGDVVLCLAPLDGHVNHHRLLAYKEGDFNPRHPEMETRRPDGGAALVIKVLAELGDEGIAALRCGGRRIRASGWSESWDQSGIASREIASEPRWLTNAEPRPDEASRPRNEQALVLTKEPGHLADRLHVRRRQTEGHRGTRSGSRASRSAVVS